ncbi:PepSY-associated TM helix domain-containing protein [Brevundimonas sp. SL130]|uniref:PepSY-associated TM helix domain-containing protein n=1 Tax=Brevundimonas sp. SL130 TaxID=2995143 RepID=UPI00226CD7FE|nr:PepSY-associated TM helix domain-containing protein [Brevundimonas sp. SL130]WAC61341.1 PepSY-associated TM helix domain-containing protein [Brevundimonas sp. SL130]
MNWRPLFWRVHRWVGLACAMVFLIVALTGTALLMEPQTNLKGSVRLNDPATSLAGIETAMAQLAVDYPHHQMGLILPGSTPQRSWQIGLRPASGEGPALSAEFDPGSGRIMRVDMAEASLRDDLLKLHNSLFLGVTGKLVVLAMALGVVCLTITGVAMMRRRWRTLTSSPLASPLRVLSLHHWTGLVGGLFIVMWASTGFMLLVYKSLPEFGVGRPGATLAAKARPKPAPTAGAGQATASRAPLSQMVDAALALHPGGEVQALSRSPQGVMVIVLKRDAAPWRKSTTVAFDAAGAPLAAREPPGFMKVMIAAKALHTGLWERPWLRVVYLLFSLTPIALVVTGPWLWLRRRRPARLPERNTSLRNKAGRSPRRNPFA